MTPNPETCCKCNKMSNYHLDNTFDNGSYCTCPWCHTTLAKSNSPYSTAWGHQHICNARPHKDTPLCDCHIVEEMAYQAELAIARARPSFRQQLREFTPNINYAKGIGNMPHTVMFPPIPRCTTCHFLVKFTVGAAKPNCPWCWEWLYFGGGSLFHIYTHLRKCPNRPLLVCTCKNQTDEYFLEGAVETWT